MKPTFEEVYEHLADAVDPDVLGYAADWRAYADAVERFVAKARAFADKLECGDSDVEEPAAPQTPVMPPALNVPLQDQPDDWTLF
tara:strand:- start:12566 stop:12820 length:255 start_codon:yes stop_codon:yes gene_type:complete